MFIKRTVDRYKKMLLTKDRPRSGRPRTVRTPDVVKAVWERIQRNPRHRQTMMAKDLEMLQLSTSKLVRDDLGMKSYRLQKRQALKPLVKEKRLKRCRSLVQRYQLGTLPNLIFSNEKPFTMWAEYNPQNDRVISKDFASFDMGAKTMFWRQKPVTVMV